METTWKIGFLGLLVLAGTGFVVASFAGQGAVASDGGVADSLPSATVCAGCGKTQGTCGADCGCGCQDKTVDSGLKTCPGGCGNANGTCGAGCSCGCRDGATGSALAGSCSGGCGKAASGGSCGGGCGCGCGS